MSGILVGFDGSEGARRALHWAVALAARLDEPLTVLYVQRYELPPEHVVMRAGGDVVPGLEERRRTAEGLLDEAFDELGPGAPDVPIEREIVFDRDPSAVLTDRSSKADLLVVGSRGLGEFAGLLVGSVSLRCVTHSRCPVVVVPPPDD